MFKITTPYFISTTIAWICILNLPLLSFGQTSDLSQKIWDSVGGQHNWENARYFMFTCKGPDDLDSQGRSASYIWDRKTGNCRFEGITSDAKEIVVLFNLHSAEGKVFINATLQQGDELSNSQITQTVREFRKDAELLFLPTFLDGENVTISSISEKLVGSSRQLVAEISNKQTAYGTSVDGVIHVDAASGQVRHWSPENTNMPSYDVSGYKDIGSGLILPTRFVAQHGTQHVSYPVAASLVHVEPNKFTEP